MTVTTSRRAGTPAGTEPGPEPTGFDSAAGLGGFPTGAARPGADGSGGTDRRHRIALYAILALALALYTWDVQNTPVQPYYAAAVRSMASSWQAFVFGGFDVSGFISVDKLPGALWLQAISVWILGYSPFALHLPQIIEGVLSVALLYRLVRLWAGQLAGLLAALLLTLAPITVALNRVNISDTLLVLLALLGADATVRAVRTGRLAPLLVAGVWVGLAFQAKMMQAWVFLGIFGLTYLVAAPGGLGRRIGRTALTGLVAVLVSLSWVTAVWLVPAEHRPFVDGTKDNSPFTQVFEYNGFSRLDFLDPILGAREAAQPADGDKARPDPTGVGALKRAAGGSHKADPPGPLRLVDHRLGPQAGLLLPFALLTLGWGLWWRRRAWRYDASRTGFVLWGSWLGVHTLLFSVIEDIHPYYLAALTPAVAALAGAGFVAMWRLFRAPASGGGNTWQLLPWSVAATGTLAAWRAYDYPEFSGWLVPLLLWLTVISVLMLVRTRGSGRGRRLVRRRTAAVSVALALAAMVCAPAVWSFATLVYPEDGQDPTAGPLAQDEQRRKADPLLRREAARGLSDQEGEHMLRYLKRHHQHERYLVATVGIRLANRLMMLSGDQVLPVGGFTGSAPAPTTAQLASLVRDGHVRYVLIQAQKRSAEQYQKWVTGPGKCTPVDPTKYGERTFDPTIDPTLYDCRIRS